MPNLDADSQGRILFQQLLAGLPDDCSRGNTGNKTTADAMSRARLLMTVSHQASVPTVASVYAGKDSQTSAIDTLQGHVKHLTEQMSSLVNRLDGISVAAVARPQSSDGSRVYHPVLRVSSNGPRIKELSPATDDVLQLRPAWSCCSQL